VSGGGAVSHVFPIFPMTFLEDVGKKKKKRETIFHFPSRASYWTWYGFRLRQQCLWEIDIIHILLVLLDCLNIDFPSSFHILELPPSH
jgi:hypothetical protein